MRIKATKKKYINDWVCQRARQKNFKVMHQNSDIRLDAKYSKSSSRRLLQYVGMVIKSAKWYFGSGVAQLVRAPS